MYVKMELINYKKLQTIFKNVKKFNFTKQNIQKIF